MHIYIHTHIHTTLFFVHFRWNVEAPRAVSCFWGLYSAESTGLVCCPMPGIPIPFLKPRAWLSVSFS